MRVRIIYTHTYIHVVEFSNILATSFVCHTFRKVIYVL